MREAVNAALSVTVGLIGLFLVFKAFTADQVAGPLSHWRHYLRKPTLLDRVLLFIVGSLLAIGAFQVLTDR